MIQFTQHWEKWNLDPNQLILKPDYRIPLTLDSLCRVLHLSNNEAVCAGGTSLCRPGGLGPQSLEQFSPLMHCKWFVYHGLSKRSQSMVFGRNEKSASTSFGTRHERKIRDNEAEQTALGRAIGKDAP